MKRETTTRSAWSDCVTTAAGKARVDRVWYALAKANRVEMDAWTVDGFPSPGWTFDEAVRATKRRERLSRLYSRMTLAKIGGAS